MKNNVISGLLKRISNLERTQQDVEDGNFYIKFVYKDGTERVIKNEFVTMMKVIKSEHQKIKEIKTKGIPNDQLGNAILRSYHDEPDFDCVDDSWMLEGNESDNS